MKKKDWTIPFTRPAVPHELLSAGFTPLLSMPTFSGKGN